MMEAIVLAGGFGTRLRPVLPDVVKPMALVCGRPFLELLLQHLSNKGFRHVVLSLGYRAQSIRDYFGDYCFEMDISYAIEEKPLGTGGAIRFAMELCLTDHSFVFNGDTFLDLDIEVLEFLWQRTKSTLIVAREVEESARYGRMIVSGRRVMGFIEKGQAGSGLINAGCYVLPKRLLDRFPLGKPFSFEQDFLATEVKNSNIEYYISDGYFIDIGIPDDYARANVELKSYFL